VRRKKHQVPRFSLSPQAEAALLEYRWPGNLRELRHAVERACILGTSPLLDTALFVQDGWGQTAQPAVRAPLAGYLADCERRYIENALLDCGHQIGRAAVRLRISRKNLWEKMKKLGIAVPPRRGE
jgi:DNA-binding NtrC family response regulator